MASKDAISVVAERLRNAPGCCPDPVERFSAERVERATGVPADDVHQIAQGILVPVAAADARLRLLDQLMRDVTLPDGVPFERWLLLRPESAAAAPALLVRELRVAELAELVP